MTTIAIGGSIAQRAGFGGHAWAFLQYLLGFRELGYEVLFIDRLTPEMTTGPDGSPSPSARSRCIAWLVDVMRGAGLEDSYALLIEGEDETVGLSRREALTRIGDSAFLLNVMGFISDEEILAAADRRVFLDIDPGFSQMWHELGLADPFRGHDDFVTIGENIGEPDCGIPTCGLEWVTTPQPIALKWWPRCDGGRAFTTVASWRGPYGPIVHGGRRYGLRVHELRKLIDLPRLSGANFELALDIDGADAPDREALQAAAWNLVDPRAVAGDPWSYRRYIQRSRAELMVAKGLYVAMRSGWFSDRSICYLASGKPVLAQYTGFDRQAFGEGVVGFSDLDEAAAGVAEISGNWTRHSRAAREVAEECFDSRKVLGRLLAELG